MSLRAEIENAALEHDAKLLLDAMLGGATVTTTDGIEGVVWEIYRSIATDNIKVRITDKIGKVHHRRIDQFKL